MLALLMFPDLAKSLDYTNISYIELLLPLWSIEDFFLSLGIYDWSVRPDSQFADIVGNLYKFGMSASIHAPFLNLGFHIFKESKNRFKTTLRIVASIPSVVLMFELIFAFFITCFLPYQFLVDHLGHLVSFIVLIFLVMPLTGGLFAVIFVVVCLSVWRAIWKNEQYFLGSRERE